MAFAYKERVRDWLQQRLCGRDSGIWSGSTQIIVDKVSLEQGEKGEVIVVLFRVLQRPDCLFGFRTDPSPPLVLEPDGTTTLDEGPEGHAEVIYVNLKERVEAADMGLPNTCAEKDITWIGPS